MDTLSIFDFMPEEEAAKFKPIKSTDWNLMGKDKSRAISLWNGGDEN